MAKIAYHAAAPNAGKSLLPTRATMVACLRCRSSRRACDGAAAAGGACSNCVAVGKWGGVCIYAPTPRSMHAEKERRASEGEGAAALERRAVITGRAVITDAPMGGPTTAPSLAPLAHNSTAGAWETRAVPARDPSVEVASLKLRVAELEAANAALTAALRAARAGGAGIPDAIACWHDGCSLAGRDVASRPGSPLGDYARALGRAPSPIVFDEDTRSFL